MTSPARLAVLLFLAACSASDDEGPILVGLDPTDAPIAGLDATWRARFREADATFDIAWRPSQGLGPLYIRTSCASCHEADAKGPGFVTKMAGDALPWGDTVRPYAAGGASTTIEPDPDAQVSTRIGPAVFGRGFMEAIDDAEIERVAAEQAARGGPIRGRVRRVPWRSAANPDARFHDHGPGDDDLVGRFGLKASVATLDDFAAGALVGDMSITSPLRPDELPNPEGLTDDDHVGIDATLEVVNLDADYVRLLDLPRRVDPQEDDALARGADTFVAIGCADCHVPSLHTRRDWPIAAFADVDVAVFTDLLVHDMGDGLADGVIEGDAGPRDWRTAPLVGLRHLRSYLHDGRADTLDDAIVAHGDPESEARLVTEAYLDLDDDAQADLLAYLATL